MSGLGRTIDPITAPNQSFKGDILNPASAPSIKAHASKGRNASGRSWKLRPQKRASSLITKNRANNKSKSWEQQAMIEERIQAKRDKRERRLENERRRMENEYNNAKRSMQTLNHKKLGTTMKAMNKKQLRQIKKTRMNTKTGVVEFVGAYEK
jgi:hypothetical protein